MTLRLILTAAVLVSACYGATLGIWFRGDDFAWLGLRDFTSAYDIFFKPAAQGSVRFLSERLFFWATAQAFGIESAVPFRVVILSTLLVNALLLYAVLQRLAHDARSAAAGVAVWLLQPGVSMAVSWVSSYNQMLVVACLLTSLLGFLDRRRWLCWTAFLLGFGALEINVMLPALLVAARPARWRETLPFFGVSAAYSFVWWQWIRLPVANPAYAFHADVSMLPTLWQYVQLTLGHDRSPWWLLFLLPLAIEWRRCARGLAWFLLLLLPVLPLRDHVSDYYLASASIGLAAAVAMLSARPAWQAIVVAVLLVTGWQSRNRALEWNLEVTRQIEAVVLEVRRLHDANPGRPMTLAEVPPEVQAHAVVDDPFRLYGIRIAPPGTPGAIEYRYSAEPSSSR